MMSEDSRRRLERGKDAGRGKKGPKDKMPKKEN